MTELKSEGGGGVVRVSDDVLAVIAGTAALESEGVAGLAGHFSSEVGSRAVRKHMAKGVLVKVNGQRVKMALAITAKMGVKLHEVSKDVQQRVKTAVETMTGLDVIEVNVSVSAVAAEAKKA
ncbi:MAG: Asp23/Gls24 family envelope stress response protein [Defluviitaleaceae bacterium]|nr:Asp23/Gls24 family envelope stress response protein [Defluviitaleaceae bacterium]